MTIDLSRYSVTHTPLSSFSQEKQNKTERRLFKKAQAFCEEQVFRCLLEVFWYAESENQC